MTKRLLITEYGEEKIPFSRQFVLEVPDDVEDEGDLDHEAITAAAEAQGIGWEQYASSDGCEIDYFDIEGNAEDINVDGIPVIRLPEEEGEE
jgi:hypothetical protein